MLKLMMNLLARNPLTYMFPRTIDMIVTGLIVMCAGMLIAVLTINRRKSVSPMLALGGGLCVGLLGAVANSPDRVSQIDVDSAYANPFPWLQWVLVGTFVVLVALAIRALLNKRRTFVGNMLVACTYLMGAALSGVTFCTPALINTFPFVGTNINNWIVFTNWMWAAVFITMCFEALLLVAAGVTMCRTRPPRNQPTTV